MGKKTKLEEKADKARAEAEEAKDAAEIAALDRAGLSAKWRERSLEYAAAINAFVERGLQDGWDAAGKEPRDRRHNFAARVLDLVREANAAGDTSRLREEFPPAWEPFVGMLADKGRSLVPMAWIDDDHIAIHLGAAFEQHEVVVVSNDAVVPAPGVRRFGWAPDRSCIAVAIDDAIEVRRSWHGEVLRRLAWPSGREGTPSSAAKVNLVDRDRVTMLVPFPGGERVILACEAGIFVLSDEGPRRLYPPEEQLCRVPDDEDEAPAHVWFRMEHCAISPRGDLVLLGSQDGKHVVLDDRLQRVAEVGPHSEYPHFAWFSADGSVAAFNACHFYDGTTIGVDVARLRGLSTDHYDEHDAIRTLEDGARVYAAVARDNEMIVGDAHGYLMAFDLSGKPRWRYFIGSTINALDLSPDGKRLAVTSHAGLLCILELDVAERDPFAITTGKHRELRRWLFWQGEPPLRW